MATYFTLEKLLFVVFFLLCHEIDLNIVIYPSDLLKMLCPEIITVGFLQKSRSSGNTHPLVEFESDIWISKPQYTEVLF